MDRPDVTKLGELRVDLKNLYREEMFTDLSFATIRQLTPVLPDGQRDERRKMIFVGQTQIGTPAGAIPLQFEIDAKGLKQALEKFPESVEKAVEEFIENAKEAQRQAESRIVVPGGDPGGRISLK